MVFNDKLKTCMKDSILVTVSLCDKETLFVQVDTGRGTYLSYDNGDLAQKDYDIVMKLIQG